jgi:mannose-6-phosphate isomerase-like protein (cupin superfamily)
MIDDVDPKPSTCGPIREFWQAADGTCDLAHIVVLPGKATERHWHARLTEVYAVVAGEGVLEIDGVDTAVSSRRAAVIPPRARHQLRNTGDCELEVYVLCHPKFDPGDVHAEPRA